MSADRDDIGSLRRWAEHAAKRAADLEEELDRLAAALARYEQAGPAAPPAPAPRKRAPKPDAEKFLRRAAELGVDAVALRRRPDGSAAVRISSGVWFSLPAALADVLELLITPPVRPGSDGFVAWTAFIRLAAALGKKQGRPVNKHALEQRLVRLRQHLWAAGANPYLVMSSSRGVRFALRATRPKPTTVAANSQPKL